MSESSRVWNFVIQPNPPSPKNQSNSTIGLGQVNFDELTGWLYTPKYDDILTFIMYVGIVKIPFYPFITWLMLVLFIIYFFVNSSIIYLFIVMLYIYIYIYITTFITLVLWITCHKLKKRQFKIQLLDNWNPTITFVVTSICKIYMVVNL